jgi:hypothetical protein
MVFTTDMVEVEGHKEEARAETSEVLRLDPKYSVENLASRLCTKDGVKLKMRMDALRGAGLPV